MAAKICYNKHQSFIFMDTAKASREVYGNAKPRRRIRRLPEQPAAAEQNAQESERARQRQGTARGGSGGPWGTAPPAAAHPPGAAATGAAAPPYSGTPGGPAAARAPGSTPPAAAVVLSCAAAQPGQRAASPPMLQTAPAGPAGDPCGHSGGHSAVGRGDYPAAAKQQSCGKCAGWHRADRPGRAAGGPRALCRQRWLRQRRPKH